MNDVIQYPLYRDDLFSKVKRVEDYQKCKLQYQSTCVILDRLNESLASTNRPKNPREDMTQCANKDNFRVLRQQKLRLEERMAVLEKQIKQDIESEK